MNKLYVLVVASAIAISGCGGGSGGSGSAGPVILDGVFKDSNVEGLSYVSGGQTGITDGKGAFKYEEGSQVSFSIAGVELGNALGKAIISPVDLVSNGSLASNPVINRVRFLMMLDKDNDASNGIEISKQVQDAIQNVSEEQKIINFASENFTTEEEVIALRVIASSADTTSGNIVNHDFPSKEEAVAHLRTTLLCSFAGGFRGTYSGDETGNVAFVVDPATGNLSGSSYNSVTQESVEINAITPIDFDTDEKNFVSAEDSGKNFTGKFNSTDALSGEWENLLTLGEKGSFSATRIGGDSDAIYRYAATFLGLNNSDKGLLTFDVDIENRVKGKAYNVITGVSLDMTGRVENDELKETTLSDGTKLSGFLGGGTLSGSLKEENGSTASFLGSGCQLN